MTIHNRIQAQAASDENRLEEVSYEQYTAVLSWMQTARPETARTETAWSLTLPAVLRNWAEEAKTLFDKIASEVKLGVDDLLSLFKTRDMFGLMRAIKFNLVKLWTAIRAFTKLIPSGIMKVMHHLSQTGVIQQVREGTKKIDDVLNEYPILKRLIGPAVAGLLLYIWMQMTFVGDFEYDMDLTFIVDAFLGKFNLTDLFLSPQGLAMLTLFGVGTITGISFVWLGDSLLNVLLGLCFTAARKAHKSGVASKLKPLLELKKY